MGWQKKKSLEEGQEKPVLCPKLYQTNRQKAKKLAREAYFNYAPMDAISEELGVPWGTMVSWATPTNRTVKDYGNGWRVQREKADSHIIDEIYKKKKKNTEHIFGLSLDNLKRGLTALMKREVPINVSDMQKLSSIVMDLHKVLRLEEGTATDIVQTIDVSPDGILKLLEEIKKADPHVDYELKDTDEIIQ